MSFSTQYSKTPLSNWVLFSIRVPPFSYFVLRNSLSILYCIVVLSSRDFRPSYLPKITAVFYAQKRPGLRIIPASRVVHFLLTLHFMVPAHTDGTVLRYTVPYIPYILRYPPGKAARPVPLPRCNV